MGKTLGEESCFFFFSTACKELVTFRYSFQNFKELGNQIPWHFKVLERKSDPSNKNKVIEHDVS